MIYYELLKSNESIYIYLSIPFIWCVRVQLYKKSGHYTSRDTTNFVTILFSIFSNIFQEYQWPLSDVVHSGKLGMRVRYVLVETRALPRGLSIGGDAERSDAPVARRRRRRAARRSHLRWLCTIGVRHWVFSSPSVTRYFVARCSIK